MGEIEIARLLAEREVPGPVDRELEDGRIVAEDRGGAFPLLDAAVGHDDASHASLRLHGAWRDRGTVFGPGIRSLRVYTAIAQCFAGAAIRDAH